MRLGLFLVGRERVSLERCMRGPAVGSRPLRGIQVSAILYSLIETAKLVGVEPMAHLRTATLAGLRSGAKSSRCRMNRWLPRRPSPNSTSPLTDLCSPRPPDRRPQTEGPPPRRFGGIPASRTCPVSPLASADAALGSAALIAARPGAVCPRTSRLAIRPDSPLTLPDCPQHAWACAPRLHAAVGEDLRCTRSATGVVGRWVGEGGEMVRVEVGEA